MKKEMKEIINAILKDVKENKVFTTPYYMIDMWILVIRHIDSGIAQEIEEYVNAYIEENIK